MDNTTVQSVDGNNVTLATTSVTTIEQLQASVASAQATVDSLTNVVAQDQANLATAQTQLQTATALLASAQAQS